MRIACVQANVEFAAPDTNARRAVEYLERLRAEGVDFAVFPEAFLTGYCVSSDAEAKQIAISPTAESFGEIKAACDRLAIHAVVGFAESCDGQVKNSAAFFIPGQDSIIYSKTHLPELGLDKFVAPGDELPVFDTELGKIGILICFDMRFPEAARTLTLKGAELIVLPTNWPEGAEISAEHICIARAAENRVFFATCNRTGTENGFTFIGRSKIIAPSGKVLASAGSREEVIMADIDLAEARTKRNVTIPGKYETDVVGPRRPELYGPLTNAN